MIHICSFSGGLSSAVMTDRVIKKYSRKKIIIWIADTLIENEDLWRFVSDCMKQWGGKLFKHVDGRTPFDVAEQKQIIPNQKIAPCTFELKIKPFTNWLWKLSKPVTIHLGYSNDEFSRIDKRRFYHRVGNKLKTPKGYGRRIHGVYEDFPLIWYPSLNKSDVKKEFDQWNIELPEMYQFGYRNNNCGGQCFRQTISDWLLTREYYPDRFYFSRDWELKQREHETRKNYSICRRQVKGQLQKLTLDDIDKMYPKQLKAF